MEKWEYGKLYVEMDAWTWSGGSNGDFPRSEPATPIGSRYTQGRKPTPLTAVLNHLGHHGWELVMQIPGGGAFILKRRIG